MGGLSRGSKFERLKKLEKAWKKKIPRLKNDPTG
jgi:hypothetical protein